MKAIDWILRCYPPRWRERYQEEIVALLEQHTITTKTLLDLLLGALDARLDPTYRSKDGFMFQNIRDMRSLSILYICTLIVFLFSSTFWLTLNGSLAFQDNALGSITETLGSICVFIVPLLGLIALLCFAWIELKNSFQNRRWGILLFALLCLGCAIALFSSSIMFPPAPDFPLFVYIPDLLLVVEMVLLFSTGLFMLGVKGIRLLRNGQGRLVFFVLALVLLLPLGLLAYSLWGMRGASPGEIVYLPPGSFSVGDVAFSSVVQFLWFIAQGIAPYLTLLKFRLTDRKKGSLTVQKLPDGVRLVCFFQTNENKGPLRHELYHIDAIASGRLCEFCSRWRCHDEPVRCAAV